MARPSILNKKKTDLLLMKSYFGDFFGEKLALAPSKPLQHYSQGSLPLEAGVAEMRGKAWVTERSLNQPLSHFNT